MCKKRKYTYIKKDIESILDFLRNKTEEQIMSYDIKDLFIDDMKEDTINKMREKANIKNYELGEMTPLKKICCYKISANDLKIDCDVSLFSIIIYALAFDIKGKVKKQYSSDKKYLIYDKRDEITYAGDTMNSYATTTRKYFRENCYMNGYLKYKYYNLSQKNYWEACILDNYDDIELLIPDYIKRFLVVYHTIGNMIPIPYKYFNVPRARKTNDYWDKTLKGIFENDFENIIEGQENIIICKEWYQKKYHTNWEEFVKKTYMSPFVQNGEPIKLWYDNSNKYEKFYDTVTKAIIERGKMIAQKLKLILNEKTNEEIMKEYFLYR